VVRGTAAQAGAKRGLTHEDAPGEVHLHTERGDAGEPEIRRPGPEVLLEAMRVGGQDADQVVVDHVDDDDQLEAFDEPAPRPVSVACGGGPWARASPDKADLEIEDAMSAGMSRDADRERTKSFCQRRSPGNFLKYEITCIVRRPKMLRADTSSAGASLRGREADGQSLEDDPRERGAVHVGHHVVPHGAVGLRVAKTGRGEGGWVGRGVGTHKPPVARGWGRRRRRGQLGGSFYTGRPAHCALCPVLPRPGGSSVPIRCRDGRMSR
jgi:hypothetical protein